MIARCFYSGLFVIMSQILYIRMYILENICPKHGFSGKFHALNRIFTDVTLYLRQHHHIGFVVETNLVVFKPLKTV